MKDQILEAHATLLELVEAFEGDAKTKLADFAMGSEMTKVTKLAPAIQSLHELAAEIALLAKPLKKVTAEVEALSKSAHAKDHQTALRIRFRESGGRERLFAQKHAANTLAEFITYAVNLGDADARLRKLATITKGGQQLVSRFPEQDYINPKSGKPYSYLPLGDTGWAIRTQTSTKDKVIQIEESVRLLGMDRRSLTIETFEK